MARVPMRWVVVAALLAAGCVSQKTYDESLDRNAQLEREYQQLNEQMGSEVSARNVQITRLQTVSPGETGLLRWSSVWTST